MRLELVVRFDYGSIVPWVRRVDGAWRAIAGPDGLELCTPVRADRRELQDDRRVHGRASRTGARSCWGGFRRTIRGRLPTTRPRSSSRDTTKHWRGWSARCDYTGEWRDAGVAVAAHAGVAHVRADRRDRRRGDDVAARVARRHAQLGLPVLLGARRDPHPRGVDRRAATATRRRAGVSGCCAPWPGGPEDAADHVRRRRRAAPHRDRARLAARLRGLPTRAHRERRARAAAARRVRRARRRAVARRALRHGRRATSLVACCGSLLESLETRWREPDEGIWEVRGPRRHFTHSKVMCWVAFDRAIAIAEQLGFDGPIDRWRAIRDEIHDEVCERAYNAEIGAFTQSYDTHELDAAVLMIPLVGFLPGDDPRVVSTIEAIGGRSRRWPHVDGFVMRYIPTDDDGRRDRRAGRRVPAVQLLDGRGPGTRGRGAPTRARCSSVCSPSPTIVGLYRGGVRPARPATPRQFPAGVHAPRVGRGRAHARAGAVRRMRRRRRTIVTRRSRRRRDVTCGHGLDHERGEGIRLAAAGVALHGYGADERDLGGLLPYLDPDGALAAVLPAGAVRGAGHPGYSWYGMFDGDPAGGSYADALARARRPAVDEQAEALGLPARERSSPGSRRAPGSRSGSLLQRSERPPCGPRPCWR